MHEGKNCGVENPATLSCGGRWPKAADCQAVWGCSTLQNVQDMHDIARAGG